MANISEIMYALHETYHGEVKYILTSILCWSKKEKIMPYIC